MTSVEPRAQRPGLSPRARLLLPVLLTLLVGLSVYHYSRAPAREGYLLQGDAMGTTWTLKLAGATPSGEAERALERLILTRLARIDGQMSNWKQQSEISRFNAYRRRDAFAVSPQTRAVLRIAREVSELSGGAFDVTVGPLVALWGFGPGAVAPREPPSEAQIRQAAAAVGYRKFDWDAAGLRKQVPALELDLSAVAKGYAVDFVCEGLETLGYQNFLFELGGELLARGNRSSGTPWRVAVEAPEPAGRAVHRIVRLRDAAMATSGDYRNFYERDGRRYSHTIDPRSGRPIEHALASVTVVHAEAAWADALATALNVLGPAEGLALAERERIAAYFIAHAPEGFGVSMTEPFRALLAREPAPR